MKILGVLGGMGPLATVDFLNKLVNGTYAEKDADHIHTITDSNCMIPDRTGYIIRQETSPLADLLLSAERLQDMGASAIVMPCNTAHYFAREIKEHISIPFINMIEECAKNLVGEDRVGLLATKGTYRAGIYRDTFIDYDIEVIHPPYELMLKTNEVIYRIKRGECYGSSLCRDQLLDVIHWFREQEIDKVILGCTELPLLYKDSNIEGIDLVDPTEILALSAIKHMGKKVRRLKNQV